MPEKDLIFHLHNKQRKAEKLLEVKSQLRQFSKLLPVYYVWGDVYYKHLTDSQLFNMTGWTWSSILACNDQACINAKLFCLKKCIGLSRKEYFIISFMLLNRWIWQVGEP